MKKILCWYLLLISIFYDNNSNIHFKQLYCLNTANQSALNLKEIIYKIVFVAIDNKLMTVVNSNSHRPYSL